MKGKIGYYTSEVNFGADIFLFHYYVQTFPFNLLMPNCIQDNDYQQVLGSRDVECLVGNKWSRNALWPHLGENWRLFDYYQESLRRLRNCTITSLKRVTALCRRNTLGAFQCDRGIQSWKSVSIYSFIPKIAKTKIHENTRFPLFKFGETNKLVGESTAEKAPFFFQQKQNRLDLMIVFGVRVGTSRGHPTSIFGRYLFGRPFQI